MGVMPDTGIKLAVMRDSRCKRGVLESCPAESLGLQYAVRVSAETAQNNSRA
jgi:hypothetical protein